MGSGPGLVGCTFGSSTSLISFLGKLDVNNVSRAFQKKAKSIQLKIKLHRIHLKELILDLVKYFFKSGV